MSAKRNGLRVHAPTLTHAQRLARGDMKVTAWLDKAAQEALAAVAQERSFPVVLRALLTEAQARAETPAAPTAPIAAPPPARPADPFAKDREYAERMKRR
jgi:hypothetical protein